MSGYPPQYPGQQPQPATGAADQFGQQQRQDRPIIGGWSAQQYGMEQGKHIEYVVTRVPFRNGGSSLSVEFFKPYYNKNRELKKSWSFMEGAIKELVERINHFMMNYAKNKGVFVFQPMADPQVQQFQPPAPPQHYPVQQGVLPPPQQWGAPPLPPQAPPAQQAQPQQYPPPPGFNPQGGGNQGGGW